MNAQQLLHIIDRLQTGVNPVTNHPFDVATSCLAQPAVRAGLARFRGLLSDGMTTREGLPDEVLRETHLELTQLGYRPTPEQIVKVLRGSRSIADPTLRAVTAYGKYRSRFGKRFIEKAVAEFASRHADLFGKPAEASSSRKKKEKPAHLSIPFFRENDFDKLTDAKAEEIAGEIMGLGFSRPTDKLPDFKKKARINYARAYEPWSRAEQALLIEAMCYTNDAAKIAGLFGRTAKSITDTGLKLIYDSQRRGS